jgi:ribosomal protein S18 acetylase RimI-like enzyme
MFAPFDPTPTTRPPRRPHRVRAATPSDIPAMAAIWAEREGTNDADARATRIERWLELPNERVLVALDAETGALLAYGRASRSAMLPPSITEPAWSLAGLTVAPHARRMGLGDALTRARLEGVFATGADRCLYVASAINQASIALHQRFGFELLREVEPYGGLTFTGGIGALYETTAERFARR